MLEITIDGAGFDPAAVPGRGGLGLKWLSDSPSCTPR
jgi:hypothetical protein